MLQEMGDVEGPMVPQWHFALEIFLTNNFSVRLPGISETLDWTSALLALNQKQLGPEIIDDTLGLMLKYQDDIELVRGEPVRAMLERSKNRGPRRGRRGGGNAG